MLIWTYQRSKGGFAIHVEPPIGTSPHDLGGTLFIAEAIKSKFMDFGIMSINYLTKNSQRRHDVVLFDVDV